MLQRVHSGDFWRHHLASRWYYISPTELVFVVCRDGHPYRTVSFLPDDRFLVSLHRSLSVALDISVCLSLYLSLTTSHLRRPSVWRVLRFIVSIFHRLYTSAGFRPCQTIDFVNAWALQSLRFTIKKYSGQKLTACHFHFSTVWWTIIGDYTIMTSLI